MEKDLLGVRMKPVAAKRRRKVAVRGSGGGRGLAKAIADYLASDSYMYAPLVSDPQQQQPPLPPPPAAAPATASPEKEVSLVKKYRGSWRAAFTAC